MTKFILKHEGRYKKYTETDNKKPSWIEIDNQNFDSVSYIEENGLELNELNRKEFNINNIPLALNEETIDIDSDILKVYSTSIPKSFFKDIINLEVK